MRMNFCDHHISIILKRHLEKERPLDLLLSSYFRSHKSLGAKDRKIIGETLYRFVRFKSLFLNLAKTPKELLEALKRVDLASPPTSSSLTQRLGISEFLFEKFSKLFGKEKAISLAEILNGEAPVTIRANGLKISREALLCRLSEKFQVFPCEKAPMGIQFLKREPLFSLAEFKEGLFEMQDEGSQLVADFVEVQPKEHFLDFCSGSGGKALAIAPKMKNSGQIYLHDTRPEALLEARKRLKRAKVENVQFNLPKKKVDWLLLDVPCSGTGTLRRNPDAKWKIDQPLLDRCIFSQREIFEKAFHHLKAGGRLVYVTCSILPEENEEQVNYFLSSYPARLEKQVLFYPEKGGMDGFFAAVFKKENVIK